MTRPLRGRAVTVVGIYYAPDSTGIAPYTTDLCQTLVDLGARVTAIVGVPHYPRWRVDAGYRFRLARSETLAGVHLTRVRHLVPRRQDAVRRGLYELTFYAGSRLAARRQRPDIVLGVTPNLAGAATARALSARRGVPLGIVVQDLVGRAAAQSGIAGGGRVSARVAEWEAAILRRADRVAVISPAFTAPLAGLGVPPDRIVELPNYTHIRPVRVSAKDARRRLGWPADRHLLVHTGNMGLKQGLDNVVEAARLAAGRRDDLLFVLVGDGSTRDRLRRCAAGLGNVLFVDPVSEEDYPLTLAAADCLLLNERASVLDMSMPSKLTSYLAAGRPVVAATQDGGAAAAEIRRSGAGVIVPPDRPARLLDAVVQLVDDPDRRVTLGASGYRYAVEWLSRERARARIGAFARDLCGRAPRSGAGSSRPWSAASQV